jgi:hypothetical protein
MKQITRTTTLTTGKILTPQIRKSIKALTKSSTPARTTATRLQSLLSTFRARVKKLAKTSNGRKRH